MLRMILGIVLLTWLATANAAEPAKLSQDEAERLVFQCWKEVSVEHNGEKKAGGFGYCFTPKGGPGWPLQGELTSGGADRKILIDAAASPMRMDIVFLNKDGTERFVIPGIFKVDGGKLVLVSPDGTANAYRKDGNYPIRPTGFEPTKENKYTRKTLTRCDYLDQDD